MSVAGPLAEPQQGLGPLSSMARRPGGHQGVEKANGASGPFTPTGLWSHIRLIPHLIPGGDSVRRRFCCFRRKIGSEQPPAGWAAAELSRRSVPIWEPGTAELHRRAATPTRSEMGAAAPRVGLRKRTGSGQSREKRYELSDESELGGRPQPRLPLPGASAPRPGEQGLPWPGAGILRRWGWLRSCPGPEQKTSIGAQSTRGGSGRGSGRGPPAAPIVGDMGASQAGRRQPPHQSSQRILARQQPAGESTYACKGCWDATTGTPHPSPAAPSPRESWCPDEACEPPRAS